MKNFTDFKNFLSENGSAYEELVTSIAEEDGIELSEAEETLEDTFNTEDPKELLNNGFIIYYEGRFAENFKTNWAELKEEYLLTFEEKKENEAEAKIPSIRLVGELGSYTTAYYHDKNIPSFKIGEKVKVLNRTYKVFRINKENIYARLINGSGKLSKNKFIVISEQLVEMKSNGSDRYFKEWL